ncbi:MAG: P-loop NTPase [Mangrovibacterium sp.]
MKIAIASGKGGTGKTLVATNLFQTIRKAGEPVILIDCDSEEPNDQQFINGNLIDEQLVTQNIPVIDTDKCTYCGKCQEYCHYNAILVLPEIRHIQVVEDLCHDCGACLYACQRGAITEKEKMIGAITKYDVDDHSALYESRIEVGVYSSVPLIREAIKDAENGHFAIFDAPPGTSCPFIATVEQADYVVLVTEPTPFGLNDLKLSVETLQELGKSFGVVINRAGLGNNAVQEYLAENKIQLLAEIPFDRKIAASYSEGILITDSLDEYRELFAQLYETLEKKAS